MKLNEIRDNVGATKARRRVGRGIGSGMGKTSSKGQKGQKSRSGVSLLGFEGGQTPLYRRLPKRGFNNARFRKNYTVINLDRIADFVESGKIKDKVSVEVLREAGVLKGKTDGIRILGRGELKTAINFEIAGVSKSAQEAIEKSGGSVTIVGTKNA